MKMPVPSPAEHARLEHPTGATALIVTVVGVVVTALGLDLPAEIIAAIAVVIIGGVSLFTPKLHGFPYPAGLSSAGALLLVWIAQIFGADLSSEIALTIVGLVPAVISFFNPRFNAKKDTADNVPTNGGTGPDPDPTENLNSATGA